MAQVKTKIKGEYTYPSEYSEIPEGGLRSGKNCVINRDSVAEPRRGFGLYKAISSLVSDRAKTFLFYKTGFLAHFGSTIAKDGTDPFTAMAGTFSAPTHGDSYVPKIKYVEANSNLLFTSDTGIQKLDSLSGTIQKAGAPRGLDVNLTLTGSSGFMTTDTEVAYRILWGYRDANNNLILGAPSQRITIANSSGGSRDVIVNSSIPQEVTTSWLYQVYRTGLSLNATTDPGDECGLVYESNPSSTDISNKYISFTDSTPDSLRGATIYTAASQEGIAQANDTPPSAKDLASFKNCVFYANTIQKQNLTITLLSAGGNSGVSYHTFTGNTNSNTSITNVASITGVTAGQTITGTGIPANTTILSTSGAGPYTLTISQAATATAVGVTLEIYDVLTIGGVTYLAAATEDVANRKFAVATAGTPAQNIADTANSLVKVINRNTTNTTVYAYYYSNADELPGKIFLEARSLGTSTFTAIASSHGSTWNPQLPTSGSTVISTSEQKKNRLHVSKIQRPEATPRAQYFDMGSADKAILRVLPLRDSLIIMKEDGFYRLTGTTPANFQVDPLDLNAILIGPETAVTLNNQIHAITNQGISTASDTGIGVISRPIEDQITAVLAYSNFATAAFAVAYETERQYILSVPTNESASYSQKQHVYNTFTQAWTHWERDFVCGGVNPADNKLYFGHALSNKIVQERKALDYTDYCDEDIAVVITNVSSTLVTLTDTTGITVGDVLLQSNVPFGEVTAINTTTNVITLDYARPFINGAATIKTSYECRVEMVPQYCGNPGIMKHIREVHALLKVGEFRTAQLIFSSDVVFSTDSVDITGFSTYLWGYFGWGNVPWGGYSNLFKDRTWPHSDYQRCTWLNVTFRHRGAFGKFGIAGFEFTFEPLTERTGG